MLVVGLDANPLPYGEPTERDVWKPKSYGFPEPNAQESIAGFRGGSVGDEDGYGDAFCRFCAAAVIRSGVQHENEGISFEDHGGQDALAMALQSLGTTVPCREDFSTTVGRNVSCNSPLDRAFFSYSNNGSAYFYLESFRF